MSDMRNQVVHDYSLVDLDVVWDLVPNDRPSLSPQIDAPLALG